jgi:hypothetical protein
MPGMSDRRRLQALLLIGAIAVAGCVPTPVGRPVASPSAAAEANASGTAVLPGTSPADSPSASPDPAATPSFVRPTPNPSPTFLVYVVRAGDTLTSVARQFGTTARSIAYWNRAQYPSLDPDSETYEPDRIKVGWTLLLIPAAVIDEDELPDPTPSPSPTPTATPAPTTTSPMPQGDRRPSGAIV